MDQQILSQICDQVYRRFPEVAGSRPDVRDRPGNQSLLIFRSAASAGVGRAMARTIRVVASDAGKILKITTSR